MITRYQLPAFVQRGVTTSVPLDVYDDAGAQQTATVGTVSIYAGAKLIVDGASATTLGPPASYDLTAATTTDESLSDQWLAIFALTIGGVVYTFQRPIYLVRRILYPVITDTDLTDLHSDLLDLIDPDQTTYEAQRNAAFVKLQRWLISKGRRPELVIDSWALADLHRYLTLELIFRDFALSTSDGRYQTLADDYRALVAKEQDSVQFNYDRDEDGVIDDEKQSATPIVYFGRAPGNYY